MTDEAKRCVQSCREWYVTLSYFGRGNKSSAKELLTTADLIVSLSAELEQVQRERDAYFDSMKGICAACKKAKYCMLNPLPKCPNWQWRGVEANQ